MSEKIIKWVAIINFILLLGVIRLWWGSAVELNRLSSENIAQNVVLCNYIEDLQRQTGVDTKISPNCQDDIELFTRD